MVKCKYLASLCLAVSEHTRGSGGDVDVDVDGQGL